MEYLPGGDTMELLMKEVLMVVEPVHKYPVHSAHTFLQETLPEDTVRFYVAETIMAVETVHDLMYIHRCPHIACALVLCCVYP